MEVVVKQHGKSAFFTPPQKLIALLEGASPEQAAESLLHHRSALGDNTPLATWIDAGRTPGDSVAGEELQNFHRKVLVNDYNRSAVTIETPEGYTPVKLTTTKGGRVWAILKPQDAETHWALYDPKNKEKIELPIPGSHAVRGTKFVGEEVSIVSEVGNNTAAVTIISPSAQRDKVVADSMYPDYLDLRAVYITEQLGEKRRIGLLQDTRQGEGGFELRDLKDGSTILPNGYRLTQTEPVKTPNGDLIFAIKAEKEGGQFFNLLSVNQGIININTPAKPAKVASLPCYDDKGIGYAALPSSEGHAAFLCLPIKKAKTLYGFSQIAGEPTRLAHGLVAVVAKTKEGKFQRVLLHNQQVLGETVDGFPEDTEINRIWLAPSGGIFAITNPSGLGSLMYANGSKNFHEVFGSKSADAAFKVTHYPDLPGCSVITTENSGIRPFSVTYVVDEHTGAILNSFTQTQVRHFIHAVSDSERVIAHRNIGFSLDGQTSTQGFTLTSLNSDKPYEAMYGSDKNQFSMVNRPVQAPNGGWYSLAKQQDGGYVILNLTKGTMGEPVYLEDANIQTISGLSFLKSGEPLVIGTDTEGKTGVAVLGPNTIGNNKGSLYSPPMRMPAWWPDIKLKK